MRIFLGGTDAGSRSRSPSAETDLVSQTVVSVTPYDRPTVPGGLVPQSGTHADGEPRGRDHSISPARDVVSAPAPSHGAPLDLTESYWESTRRPLQCALFVVPLLLVYELTIRAAGPGADRARSGIDAIVHAILDAWGVGTLGVVVAPLALMATLLAWQVAAAERWRVRFRFTLGMMLESGILAFGLIGLSELVDAGLVRLEDMAAAGSRFQSMAGSGQDTGASPAVPAVWLPWIGLIGAGIYEEFVFRLLFIPVVYAAMRFLLGSSLAAGTLAVTGSAVIFALAHHMGSAGEPFTWFAFLFRWAAGIYFAWIFVARGFAVAVGTHIAYNILVLAIEWPV